MIFFFLESKVTTQNTQNNQEDDDIMWTNISLDLEEIIKMHELIVDANEIKPYDPISEISMEDQK